MLMNVFSRGVKNAMRSPLRSGAIILMFAISVALILSMLVARSSVLTKIDEVKSGAGTSITIAPAGVMGFQGGGDPLTADQLTAIEDTDHISSTIMTLSDQLSEDDTDLTSALDLGAFGERQMRFENNTSDNIDIPEGIGAGGGMGARITVTGTTDVNSVSTDGSDLTLTGGEAFTSDSHEDVAVIGSSLADENDLSVGDVFTAYDQPITVIGIYETGNTFQDGNIIMPLTTLQTLTEQEDAVTSIVATVDNSDNVSSVVSSLESSLGDDADITSDIQRAEESVSSLESIASLALAGVIGATIAGAVIVLLAMIVIIRERRREIGVMKAIGGTDTKVVGQFMIEGLTLTVIGALVGMVLGVLVSGPMTTSLTDSNTSSQISDDSGPGGDGPRALFSQGAAQINANVEEVSASITPMTLLTALAATIAVAIIGSAIPAWLTSRIRPAEILRNDT